MTLNVPNRFTSKKTALLGAALLILPFPVQAMDLCSWLALGTTAAAGVVNAYFIKGRHLRAALADLHSGGLTKTQYLPSDQLVFRGKKTALVLDFTERSINYRIWTAPTGSIHLTPAATEGAPDFEGEIRVNRGSTGFMILDALNEPVRTQQSAALYRELVDSIAIPPPADPLNRIPGQLFENLGPDPHLQGGFSFVSLYLRQITQIDRVIDPTLGTVLRYESPRHKPVRFSFFAQSEMRGRLPPVDETKGPPDLNEIKTHVLIITRSNGQSATIRLNRRAAGEIYSVLERAGESDVEKIKTLESRLNTLSNLNPRSYAGQSRVSVTFYTPER